MARMNNKNGYLEKSCLHAPMSHCIDVPQCILVLNASMKPFAQRLAGVAGLDWRETHDACLHGCMLVKLACNTHLCIVHHTWIVRHTYIV